MHILAPIPILSHLLPFTNDTLNLPRKLTGRPKERDRESNWVSAQKVDKLRQKNMDYGAFFVDETAAPVENAFLEFLKRFNFFSLSLQFHSFVASCNLLHHFYFFWSAFVWTQIHGIRIMYLRLRLWNKVNQPLCLLISLMLCDSTTPFRRLFLMNILGTINFHYFFGIWWYNLWFVIDIQFELSRFEPYLKNACKRFVLEGRPNVFADDNPNKDINIAFYNIPLVKR